MEKLLSVCLSEFVLVHTPWELDLRTEDILYTNRNIAQQTIIFSVFVPVMRSCIKQHRSRRRVSIESRKKSGPGNGITDN